MTPKLFQLILFLQQKERNDPCLLLPKIFRKLLHLATTHVQPSQGIPGAIKSLLFDHYAL